MQQVFQYWVSRWHMSIGAVGTATQRKGGDSPQYVIPCYADEVLLP